MLVPVHTSPPTILLGGNYLELVWNTTASADSNKHTKVHSTGCCCCRHRAIADRFLCVTRSLLLVFPGGIALDSSRSPSIIMLCGGTVCDVTCVVVEIYRVAQLLCCCCGFLFTLCPVPRSCGPCPLVLAQHDIIGVWWVACGVLGPC